MAIIIFYSDPDSVIARASKLRKRLSRAAIVSGKEPANKSKTSVVKDAVAMVCWTYFWQLTYSGHVHNHYQISVCTMIKSKGLMRRNGPFVECELRRKDTYSDVVEKVATFLRIHSPSSLCLYRPRGGAIIPAKELTINSVSQMWTLGAYMRLKHVGPDCVQIGVGEAEKVSCAL